MSDIADFLRARYAERRAIALAAKPGPWHSDGGSVYATHPTDEVVHYSESADHIAANDPAAVIADCDAKLAVVREHDPDSWSGENPRECPTCTRTTYDTQRPYEREPSPCRTLRLLAQPFAGHPDHKGEEWAP